MKTSLEECCKVSFLGSTTFLLIIISCLSLFLATSLYYLYRFSRIILDIQDTIEDSLDALDERYKKMNDILQTPVFFDSIEVRNCIDEIKKSRDTVLFVAKKLTDNFESEGNE